VGFFSVKILCGKKKLFKKEDRDKSVGISEPDYELVSF
jgi:hypothetical protein